jgi:hypothetical protein
MEITSFTALGNLFIDLIKEIRIAIKERKNDAKELIQAGNLLILYGSATRLSDYSAKVKHILELESKEICKNDKQVFNIFLSEIQFFGINLKNTNLSAIDIYYPGLGRELNRLINGDILLLVYFRDKLAPSYDINTKKIPKILDVFLRNYGPMGYWCQETFDWHAYPGFWQDFAYPELPENCLDNFELRREIVSFIDTLEECRNIIANIIRENWDFKELTKTGKVD